MRLFQRDETGNAQFCGSAPQPRDTGFEAVAQVRFSMIEEADLGINDDQAGIATGEPAGGAGLDQGAFWATWVAEGAFFMSA